MKLSANPFNPKTGQLLPVYRDAYLRGDLSSENTAAVDDYVQTNSAYADDTLRRYYELKQQGHVVRPVGWVQRQFELIRTEPQRFRRRAASLLAGSVLVGGAVFAGNSLPTTDSEAISATIAPVETEASAAASLNAMSMVTVRGRILDENGRPLVGATVLQKGTSRGVSTDAKGNYNLRIPVGKAATLQYGYAGYADDEVQVQGATVENMTLLPRAEKPAKKRHWLFF